MRGPTVAPAASAPDGWLHTGDLGSLSADGRLRVTGRKADTIVSGGENVAPAEVEAVLEAHPDVREAAVLGRADPRWGEAVTAIVVAQPGRTLEPGQLREHCARALAPYKVPKQFVLAAEPLPRTRLGQAPAEAAPVSFDAGAHRQASLEGWEEAASGWVRRQELLRELGEPVSHWMVQEISPQPGQRVLELAAGLGETGMLAAELVAPMGGVIVSDQAEAMLEGARARGDRARPEQPRVPGAQRRMDRPAARERGRRAVPLGLHADGRSRDRFGRDAAGAASRRAPGAGGLGPGGEQSLGAAAGAGALRARDRDGRGSGRRRPAGAVRARQRRAGRRAAGRGGFRRGRTWRRSISSRRHESFQELWDSTLDLSRRFHDAVLSRPQPEVEEIKASLAGRFAAYATAEGTLAVPGRTLVASASA